MLNPVPVTQYEFHITGSQDQILPINADGLDLEESPGCFETVSHNIPVLALGKISPNGGGIIDVEWMTAHKAHLETHEEAIEYLGNFAVFCGFRGYTSLSRCRAARMKIETPYHPGIDPEEYLYAECHYPLEYLTEVDDYRGLSRDVLNGKVIKTERCYNPAQFHSFAQKHSGKKVELCLLDTAVEMDKDWLDVPKKKNGGPAVAAPLYPIFKKFMLQGF